MYECMVDARNICNFSCDREETNCEQQQQCVPIPQNLCYGGEVRVPLSQVCPCLHVRAMLSSLYQSDGAFFSSLKGLLGFFPDFDGHLLSL